MELEKDSCRICGRHADHQHFGAQSCRSSTRHCKACRFAQCKKVGMKASAVQTNRDPLGPKYLRQKQQQASSPHQQTIIPISHKPYQQTSPAPTNELTTMPQFELTQHFLVLDQLCAGFRDFEQSEKALYALLFPEYSNEPKYRPTIHTDFIKMERGVMSSTITLIEHWFPLVKKQTPEFRSTILQNFFPTFSALIKVYRTAVVFPAPNDSRLAIAYCQFEDILNSEYHFQHNRNPAEAGRLCLGFRLRTRSMAAKFIELDVKCVEIVAMGALLLCNELEVLLGNNEEVDELRQKIFVDLHKLNEPNSSYGLRAGILCCLLSDIVVLRQQVREVVTLLKVFAPHKVELFDKFESS